MGRLRRQASFFRSIGNFIFIEQKHSVEPRCVMRSFASLRPL